jgi:hypothetical protein
MEQIIGSLSVSLLLRSLLSGVFFLVSLHVASNPAGSALGLPIERDLGEMALISLLLGIAIYAVTRSLIYPALVEWWICGIWAKKLRRTKCGPLVCDGTRDLLYEKWGLSRRTPDNEEEENARNRHLDAWGDLTHQQYSSAVAIAFGALTARAVHRHELECYWPLIGLFVLLVFSALVSDWRSHSLRECFRKRSESSQSK